MNKFMRKRKHLGGLGIGTIDENEWCKLVTNYKPTKLLRVELAMIIQADNTAGGY